MAEKGGPGPESADAVYDVAVVGGGPVGLAMAAALAHGAPGARLALIEAGRAGGDPRASAIAAGVRNVFVALGAWEAMAADANPVRAMKITDSGRDDLARPLFLHFSGELAPGEPFAHMVPNGAITSALDAVAGAALTRITGRVAGLRIAPAHAVLALEGGSALGARLVIAADGGRSALREMAGIGVFGHAYGQSGVVATIAHARAHEDTAYEHFRPSGPFASLPLRGNRSSLVWTESPARAEALTGMDRDAVAREIEAAMGSVLGTVSLETPVRAFPLELRLARRLVAQRLALVGDSAHVIHPIAGQGLNLGLKDVAALAESVTDAMRMGMDPGAAEVLSRYERWRLLDTATMAAATDGLNRLFSNDNAALRALRDFGLSVVDRIAPLKSAFIARAAGASGPKLLRGLTL